MGSREDSAREKMAELVDVEGRSDYEVEVLCRQFILAMDAILRHLLQIRPNLCLLYTSPSPRDRQKSRMPSSA